jgi:hypothetical protein
MDDDEAKRLRRKQGLFEAALTLLLDRNGGSLTFTEAEYQAMVAKYGGASKIAIHFEVLATPGKEPDEVRFRLIRKEPANAELVS